jgi:hypothetical protein
VLSGLGALALIGAARRFDGWAGLGLAAFGGLLVGRTLSGHRLGRAAAEGLHEPSTDPIDMAGEDSFPASDPPAWSPTSAGAPRQTAET